jgi:hypothetical protein
MYHDYLKLSVLNITRVVLVALVDIMCCYIARVNTKRDWLICVHVTSDKCNVSRRATSEKLLPAPTGYVRR